jgi:hypothetical protein
MKGKIYNKNCYKVCADLNEGPSHSSSGFEPGSGKWDLWWTKWRWGTFSPSTSVSPANIYCIKFSIIIITRGRYNRPVVAVVPSGPNMDSTTHYSKKCTDLKGGEHFLLYTFSCYLSSTKPGLRHLYSCNYTDVGCPVPRLALSKGPNRVGVSLLT